MDTIFTHTLIPALASAQIKKKQSHLDNESKNLVQKSMASAGTDIHNERKEKQSCRMHQNIPSNGSVGMAHMKKGTSKKYVRTDAVMMLFKIFPVVPLAIQSLPATQTSQ